MPAEKQHFLDMKEKLQADMKSQYCSYPNKTQIMTTQLGLQNAPPLDEKPLKEGAIVFPRDKSPFSVCSPKWLALDTHTYEQY